MTTGYGNISLGSTMRFSRIRGILNARNNNIVWFIVVKGKDLGTYKSRSSDRKP